MASQSLMLKLLALDRSKRKAVLDKAVNIYLGILFNIANDIYDSCIAEFYAGYVPIVYKRHGYIEGRNLYLANNNFFENGYVGFNIDENSLMPYGKTPKEKAFNSVVNGLRGGPGVSGFPMEWDTSYPNAFSKYRSIWNSGGNTIEEIFADFQANVVKDTADLFWVCLDKII